MVDRKHDMNSTTRDTCTRAIAYLQVTASPAESASAVVDEAERPVSRALPHGLSVAYLVDRGDHLEFVQHRHLAEARLTADELHAHGLANLLALAEEKVQVHAYGNVYAVIVGGTFEASLLLLRGIWSEWWSELAPGGFAVAIPARDLLAFGDASSPAALAELRALCDRTDGQVDHPLTNRLYRGSPSGWTPIDA